MNRRQFLRTSALGSGAIAALDPPGQAASPHAGDATIRPAPAAAEARLSLHDLKPARRIWYPSQRCPQNTFILFRRELELETAPRRATGWIAADSHDRLEVNGQRVQWGPAPSDPPLP